MRGGVSATRTVLLAVSMGMGVHMRAVQAELSPPNLAALRPEHPRLILSPALLAEARAKVEADTFLRGVHERALKSAEAALGRPVSAHSLPDGKRLLDTSRRVLDCSYRLAYAFLWTRDPRFKDRLWREMEAVAGFPDWNPSHFLDTAEMAHACAIALDWLYADWDANQRQVMAEALRRHAFEPGLACYRGTEARGRWWADSPNNWNLVCNGGLTAGALAVAEVYPQVAAEMLKAGFESVQKAFRTYEPDGAWPEGPGYWAYATSYAVLYLAALDSALGGDGGLRHAWPGFARTGHAAILHAGPQGLAFNYSDSGERAPSPPVLHWLGSAYGQPAYSAYRYRLGPWQPEPDRPQPDRPAGRGRRGGGLPDHPLDVLWGPPTAGCANPPALPLDAYLRRSEVVVLRSAWNDPKALYVAFKSGSNREGHNQLDTGAFVFDALGKRWALELGSEHATYQMHQLSAADRQTWHRWTYYRVRAEGHNTLVFNPSSGADQDTKSEDTMLRTGFGEAWSFGIGDLSQAYQAAARQVHRGVALLGRRQVVVQDELTCVAPAEVLWFMHTKSEIKLEEDGARAVLKQGDAVCEAVILQPEAARFEVLDAAPLPTSPDPPHQKKNDGVRKLAIRLPGVTAATLSVCLIPRPADAASVPPAYQPRPLREW